MSQPATVTIQHQQPVGSRIYCVQHASESRAKRQATLIGHGPVRALLAVMPIALVLLIASWAPADEPAVQTMRAQLGLGGVWKLGHVTPLRIEVPEHLRQTLSTLELTTIDGDGVPVSYLQSVTASELAGPTLWSTVTIGRADRGVKVRALDSTGAELQSLELTAEELGQSLPTTQTWMVAIGSSLGVEATSYTLTETGRTNFTTTVLSSADQLPNSWRGYAACDLMIVATGQPTGQPDSIQASNNQPVVAQLTPGQWSAIEQYVTQGGTAVVSLGPWAGQLEVAGPLANLIPGQFEEFLGRVDTSPLEAATATNLRLAPISATRLKELRGRIELSLLDSGARRVPWWIRHAVGKGVVHYFGSDLDHPVLFQWKDRRLLWDKILAGFWLREQRSDLSTADQTSGGSNYLGYDDLTGQLRATLDYFPATQVYSFGSIAAIIAGLLILLGPVDYFVSVRWLRRPAFSWYFSGIVIALVSVGLIWLESRSRPSQLLVNSAQIVDYLPSHGRLLVDSWTHLYSARARQVDVELASVIPPYDARIDWQGLPGKGLGGMESNLLTDQSLPGYVIQTVWSSFTEPAPEAKVAMSQVGIPASGTKCVHASWSSQLEPLAHSQLVELKGIDQIQGTLVNPLPYDLQRPVLMYHNWAYTLPSRLRSGEELTITYDMVPKDLMRRLNRRQFTSNSNESITRWDQEDRESIDRLLEIMMFYKASGGADYTKLKHRFQPRTDTSSALTLDQAILVGELSLPLGQVEITNLPADQIQREISSTWCRILLPVARPEE